MKKIIIFLFMIFALSCIANAEIFIFQNTSNMTDATADQSDPNTNNGHKTTGSYYIGKTGGGFKSRYLNNINWTLESINPSFSIDNFILSVYVSYSDTNYIYGIFPINCTWDEQIITWNNCGSETGCAGCYNDTNNILIGYTDTSIGDPVDEWKNVSINKSWVETERLKNPSDRKGFIIIGNESSTPTAIGFRTGEYFEAWLSPIIYVNASLELDLISPNITLLYPSNNSIIEDDLYINFTISEDSACIVNNTAFTVYFSNTSYYSFYENTLNNANYNMLINCTDLSENSGYYFLNVTKNKYFDVIIEYPLNNTNINDAPFNATFNLIGFNTSLCKLYINYTNVANLSDTLNMSINYSIYYNFSNNTKEDISYLINCTKSISYVSSGINYARYDNDFYSANITMLSINMTYNETYNHNIFINFSTNENAYCSLNNTAFALYYTNNSFHSFYESTLLNSFYSIFINCTDFSVNNNHNNFTLSFIKDTDIPATKFLYPVSPYYNNGNSYFVFNLTDNRDLYSFYINITQELPYGIGIESVYAETLNIAGSGQNYLYYKLLNNTEWNNATMTINSRLCDSHTNNKISEAKSIINSKNYVLFDFKDNTIIKIISLNECVKDSSYKYLDNKYSFSFGYNCTDARDFKIYSNRNIDYLDYSEYKGHFVIDNKYWLDFENYDNVIVDYICDYLSECYYKVSVNDISDILKFDSIGELNCNNEIFYLDLSSASVEEKTSLLNFDLSKTSNVIVLFCLVILYIGCMFIGFFFKNFGMLSLGFFDALFIGFILSSISILITLVIFFLNIYLFIKSSSIIK